MLRGAPEVYSKGYALDTQVRVLDCFGSCAAQLAVLSRAINSNVVTRDLTGGGKAWPDGPKGGPRHQSTEANVVFRGKPVIYSHPSAPARASSRLLRITHRHAVWAQAPASATTLRRARSSRREGSTARAGSSQRRTSSTLRRTSSSACVLSLPARIGFGR
jgi:hypothetical protein